jgi:hypothetical protein
VTDVQPRPDGLMVSFDGPKAPATDTFDEAAGRVIGCGITGPNEGDLIAEAVLAIEMGADAADIALTIHPHPTLSETVALGPRRSRAQSPTCTCPDGSQLPRAHS